MTPASPRRFSCLPRAFAALGAALSLSLAGVSPVAAQPPRWNVENPTGSVAEPNGNAVLFERIAGGLYAFAFNPYVTPPSGTRIDRYDQATGEVTTQVARPGGAFAPALT
ncbi:MAG: hypothetical protein IPK33_06425 [Gemmatimonadetes bacterium]|nr:hypothetical protein [Gemmatimonadota bacterium]